VASTPTDAREQSKEVASTAVDEARDVGRTAQGAAQTVAEDVKDEVGHVVGELRQQARTMVDETRTQLREEAAARTAGVADNLGRLADELRALANGHPDQAATARRYLDQAGSAIADVAGRLRNKDVEGLVQDVQRFARRRPGAFLATSAAIGFVAGRLVRSARDDAEASTSPAGNGGLPSGASSANTAQASGPASGVTGVGTTTTGATHLEPSSAGSPSPGGEGS
jgi:ElaB/YqjD/DUF883 family membrane-anchored ribosome-binding protein